MLCATRSRFYPSLNDSRILWRRHMCSDQSWYNMTSYSSRPIRRYVRNSGRLLSVIVGETSVAVYAGRVTWSIVTPWRHRRLFAWPEPLRPSPSKQHAVTATHRVPDISGIPTVAGGYVCSVWQHNGPLYSLHFVHNHNTLLTRRLK